MIPATEVLVIGLVGLLIAGCQDSVPMSGVPAPEQAVVRVVTRLSGEYKTRAVGSVEVAREARFVGGGRYVLILDQYPPHLRLFTTDGQPVWQGDTPRVDGNVMLPESLGAVGGQIAVLEPGRGTLWTVADDSLLLTRVLPLTPGQLPLGVIPGCEGGLILYMRDPELDVRAESLERNPVVGDPQVRSGTDWEGVEAIWAYPLAEWDANYRGHAGVAFARQGASIVMLHRPSLNRDGRVLELTCGGVVRRSYSELGLITGASYSVQVRRPRALEWTAGTIALPDGFAIALHRWFTPGFHDVKEHYYLTEIIRFVDGEFNGSVLLPGQWLLMDHDPDRGILLTMSEPTPHFVVLPENLISETHLRTGPE